MKANYIGVKFGRLTVIQELEQRIKPSGQKARVVMCRCDCGATKKITLNNLKTGHTNSCGCYKREQTSKLFKQTNKYEIFDNYVVGYTNKGETFTVDVTDFDKIKNHCWRVDGNGYITAVDKGKVVYLHRVIMEPPKKLVVDHVNHNKSDNRKSNLRICTQQENSRNRIAKGYHYIAKNNNYRAEIKIDGKNKVLGTYSTEAEAKKVRRNAEIKYFGEFAYKTMS